MIEKGIFATMKKVLIITYYWPPAGGIAVQRTLKFVKYLQDFGWMPIVYTVSNGEYPEHDPALEQQVPGNVTVIRRPIWEPYAWYKAFTGKSGKKVNRANLKQKAGGSLTEKISFWIRGNFFIPDTRRFWIKPSIAFLSDYLQAEKVDAIISTGPPHSMHLIARGVSKQMKLPWLADFRDPWTTMDYYKDLMLTSMADARHRKLELAVLKEASSVVVVGRFIQQEFEGKGAPRVRVIANGFDTTDFATESIAVDKTFALVHTGSFFTRRNPESLWKAISELKSEGHPAGNVQLKLVGRVDPPVLNSIEAFGLTGNLNLIAQVPYNEVIRIMKAAPVLLLPIDVFDGSKWVLTGKLYEYLASGRPIVCIGPLDGDAAGVVEESRAGKAFDFGDVAGLKAHLITLHQQFVAGTLRIEGSKVDQYSRKHLTGELADELNRITA